VNVERLADDVLDGHARLSEPYDPERSSETFCGARAVPGAQRAMSSRSKRTWPAVGMDQPDNRAAEGRFAATALADQADGFAGRNRKAESSTARTKSFARLSRPRLTGSGL